MTLIASAMFQDKLRAWAEPRLGVAPGELAPDFEFVGVIDTEAKRPVAVFGYNACYGHHLTMHVVSERGKLWLTRRVLALVFGYAFHYKGVARVNAVVPAHNVPIQILCLKMGFRVEGTMRCGADDGTDGILFSMLRDECRWLQVKEASHGQKERAEG